MYKQQEIKATQAHLAWHRAFFRKQVTLLQAAEASRAKDESISHVVGEEGSLPAELLRKALRDFQPVDLEHFAEERRLVGRCGFPRCSKQPMERVPRVAVVDPERKAIIPAEDAAKFCSLACHRQFQILIRQLPVDDASVELEIPPIEGEEAQQEIQRVDSENGGISKPCFGVDGVQRSHIVVRETAGTVSENFPTPGSESSTYNIEGYRSEPLSLKKTKRKKKLNHLEKQVLEQLESLGIHDKKLFGGENESFETGIQQDREERREEYGEKSLVEDLFDISTLKEDLEAERREFRSFVRLQVAFNSWTSKRLVQTQPDEEDEKDAAVEGRANLFRRNLARPAAALAALHADLTRPEILIRLEESSRNFNHERAVPFLSVAEWQIFSALILQASLSKKPLQGSTSRDQILHLLHGFIISKGVIDDAEARRLDYIFTNQHDENSSTI